MLYHISGLYTPGSSKLSSSSLSFTFSFGISFPFFPLVFFFFNVI